MDLVLELLKFIEEQIALAKLDPTAHQAAVVVVCNDAIQVLKRQLATNEYDQARAMLTFDAIYNGGWLYEWETLANQSPSKFSVQADELLEGVRRLRGTFGNT